MKLKLTSLTPIHIGNGNRLVKNVEFIQVPQSRELGFIDLKKISKFIPQNRFAEWVVAIENNDNVFDKFNLRNKKISEICSKVFKFSDTSNISELREQISSNKRPYIPGSSIKGAIKTALFVHLLKKENIKIDSAKIKNSRGYYTDSNLVKEIFGDTNNNLFKFFNTSDVFFDETEIKYLKLLNLKKDVLQFDNSKHMLVECIPAELTSSFVFSIKSKYLSENILKGQKINFSNEMDYDNIFNIINFHSINILQKKIDFIKSYNSIDSDFMLENLNKILTHTKNILNNKNQCIIQVGFASGFLGTTGGWQKDLFQTFEYQGLVIKLRDRERQNKIYPIGLPFPKTIRCTNDGHPLGFVLIERE